ncbi:MAG TPA: M48 family metallopeptidase, partial [Gemmataceae bacterium]|nr:M48 family metallopeptidase [Gemmataceae bacterium]
MARTAVPYPPSPRRVPADLTEAGPAYRRQVVLLLCSLIAFVSLYLFLVFAALALAVLSLLLPLPFNLAGVAFFGLVFLFLLKGFFRKRGKAQKSLMVEIDAEDHPLLWGFIERLCDETGAPLPYRVFLNPEVNAAVFYNQSFWSLFLPTPKNLLIGLGLVNVLNLSEFKGVLAHEFGHFSQKSMKLNSYVYVASHIIAQMVSGRDWFDDLADRLRSRPSVLAVLGWTAFGITWLFRHALVAIFFFLRRLQVSLSREMEFQADLVAVSAVGSEAAVRGLARAGFAGE